VLLVLDLKKGHYHSGERTRGILRVNDCRFSATIELLIGEHRRYRIRLPLRDILIKPLQARCHLRCTFKRIWNIAGSHNTTFYS
jgi:hypothetical protein